jgi:hypothetical protein
MKSFFLMSVALTSLMFLAIEAEATLTEGLVLHLSFDQNTVQGDKVEDLSTQGNDGIIYGEAEIAEGKYGQAVLFDGIDDYVEVPLTDSITFTTGSSLTVQAWIKTEEPPPSNDGIVGVYRESTAAFWNMHISGDAATRGHVGFNLRDVGKAHSTNILTTVPLNDGQWHHLAGVRDQGQKKARFYVDGELVGEVDDETDDINSGQSIWIGEHLSRFYEGLVDEVKVWNRPLTANEIVSAMNEAAAVAPTARIVVSWGSIKQR